MTYADRVVSRARLFIANGFTIVELLLVISIIAVMLGLLVPSISKARHEAWKLACLANQRQIGGAIVSYAMSYKGAVPPNAHNPNQVSVTRGPFRSVGGASAFYAMETSGGAMRFDKGFTANGGVDDFTWTGLGLVWALEYVPFDLASGKVFWCPAERVGSYKGSVSGFGSGPGFYWSQYSVKKWESVGDKASTITGGYAYRGLGAVNGAGLNSNSYKIDGLAKYVAAVDLCLSVLGEPTAASFAPFPRYSHYYPAPYNGFNRLYYDGHAKWLEDPNIMWKSAMPSGNTNYSNVYQNAWGLYDKAN